MAQTVEAGDSVLLDDGLISLEVLEVRGDSEVLCSVTDGGPLESKRGVNLPGLTVDLPAMSDKDREDIRFGLELDIDFVAASFIRKAADVNEVRDYVDETWKELWHGHEDRAPPQIISKVENAEALDNFDEILHASDGIMVARGDLGVEIPFEKVSISRFGWKFHDHFTPCCRISQPVPRPKPKGHEPGRSSPGLPDRLQRGTPKLFCPRA